MRVLIADDEAQARKRLRRLLGGMPHVEVVGEATNGAEVLAFVSAHPVDVVLLDIRMPELTGVEAMGLWPDGGPAIVFTTAHTEHALEAFDGGAADYVLKPVDPARLAKALERAFARVEAAPTPADRIALSTPSGLLLFAPEEIACALIEGPSTTVHTRRGRFFTDLSLSDLEEQLGPRFRRVHRQALVNLHRVVRLQENGSGGYVAHTDDGGQVPVSRRAAQELRRELGRG